jgi:DNA polymerase
MDKQKKLELLYGHYVPHTQCPLNKTEQHSLIFGTGDPNARIMLIGEAPGKTEEEQGLPFVGRSGQLLTSILESCGIKRSDIFITNVVKCRPQGNRTPTPLEVEQYKEILTKQISIIQPFIICTLGSVAIQALLNSKESITSLRGNLTKYGDICVLPTYHPAYILRNMQKKNVFVGDIKKMAAIAEALKNTNFLKN